MKRHGDVILVELEEAPQGGAEKECVLALGEVTGHSHRIESGAEKILFDPALEQHKKIHKNIFIKIKAEWGGEFPGEPFPFRAEDFEISCFVRVKEPCKIIHEEHKALSIDRHHAVIIQRDYSPKGWAATLD
jgi:hypothetical protein